MYRFRSLQLTNYSLWDEVEFEFEPGITHVYGRNRSGKSLLFSPLQPLFYDNDTIPKNGRATLAVDTKDREYEFTVFNSGKARNRFEVSIDGKEQQTETIDAARNIFVKHFTNFIQEGLFTTTVSITGLGEHPLTVGKPSQRLDWINETLAYASVLDTYIDMVDSKIKIVKDDSVKFKVLREELNGLEAVEQPDTDVEALQQRLEGITKDIRKLEARQRDVQRALEVPKVSKPKRTAKELKQRWKDLETELNDLLDKKRQRRVYKKRLEAYQEFVSERDIYKQAYIAACERYSLPKINPREAVKAYDKIIEEIKTQLTFAAKSNERYEEQAELRKLAKVPIQWADEHSYTRRLEQRRDYVTINSKIIKAHESGERHCEFCGSQFTHSPSTIRELKGMVKATQERIKELEYQYKCWKARQVELVDYVDIEKLQKRLRGYKNVRDLANEYLAVIDGKVEEPEKVGKVDEDRIQTLVKKLEQTKQDLVETMAFEKSKAALAEMEDNRYSGWSKADLTKEAEKFATELKQLYQKQEQLNEKLVHTRTQQELYKRFKRQRRDLHNRASDLVTAERDFQILSRLKKALGRDGFRTKRLEDTLKLFIDNLNELAPLIWNEPFKFEMEIAARKCNLIIHRNRKRGTAKTLSGSEQRGFQLLGALAMLRLLPDNRRCDTLILDEVEANMDKSSRQRMMQDLLPEVAKTVDNIVVVSPLTTQELYLSPDRSFIVSKKNGKSRLETA